MKNSGKFPNKKRLSTLDSRFYLITFFTKFLRNAENTCHIAILNYLFMSSMFK
ncbi:conserved hypothetical protein [Listeria monocytogenes]|nr:conserved hypothetical protein [Listeria monocytogenes FSL R2-561]AEO39241.1 conserved hypothetical protein [Listeria monocytogenes Finland 1998]AHF32577.1 hypothetical protein A430_1923 [Listeria monocytogenes serotype 1/2a str. 08-6569]AHF35568.1 hypothetical protein A431_1923 [Listeria monocytogenes serotype 1/2a str. 08-6997]AHF38559.1 hypothetical protein A435_1923 [Listeria monocytogenes serotype 1/2a str. 10-0815]AHF41500.1 hypothetical protein A437_1873 [Listeria monocytogenes serot